ncbi:uncharacterized protein LTR77_008829 [Saxophila tyrrhenica]|uniref:Major facilitator superfamily (MFS) profile domain-containing protein n=1 Tax=Saxophila tyrrhenica TaxID=1690608 RepID=A0AAV9P0D8_9PEZI|nr:hypothetical protein LTR77_008829 [Saxophila tyrrhenica]
MPTTKARRERKLPVQQLSILAICRFAEPIASTSLFPYLPEMVKSFGVPENEIGKWAGICSSMFSLCQAVMGIPWGRFSDIWGRKPAILLGLCTTMTTSLMWGFSTNLPMAIVARGLAGAGNGNVGIIRTTVAEMVPFKELQPRAFSLMPLVWNIGSIFGPTIGGALANPYNVRPREHIEHPSLLERFPYALPNIVAGCFFAIGITVGFLYLEETLDTLQGQRDYGRVLGQKLSGIVKSHIMTAEEILHLRSSKPTPGKDNERQPLLKSAADEETLALEPKAPPPPPPSYSEVLNRQAVLNLVVYTLLALHNMGFDQLLPVFMQHPTLKHRSSDSSGNPLKFAGGFGLDHFRIGLIVTAYGICGMVIQFFLFPPIARRFGVLNCLKACAIAFPIAYFLIPFTALLPTTESRVACCFAVMMIKCWCSIFAFPCSTILLTNSATSLRVLGTLNGFATSFSAVGRAAGPAIGGYMFTLGVKRGYVIAAWWTYCLLAIIAAIPVWLLVEGEGFGGPDDHVSDEEEVEDDGVEQAMTTGAGEGEFAFTRRGSQLETPPEQREEAEEEDYGGFEPITRTTTMSSAFSLGSDEYITPSGSRNVSVAEGSSRAGGSEPALSRKSSRKVMRRTSIPFGMGSVSRRYSSNLGQSLGTAGSYHGQ